MTTQYEVKADKSEPGRETDHLYPFLQHFFQAFLIWMFSDKQNVGKSGNTTWLFFRITTAPTRAGKRSKPAALNTEVVHRNEKAPVDPVSFKVNTKDEADRVI